MELMTAVNVFNKFNKKGRNIFLTKDLEMLFPDESPKIFDATTKTTNKFWGFTLKAITRYSQSFSCSSDKRGKSERKTSIFRSFVIFTKSSIAISTLCID